MKEMENRALVWSLARSIANHFLVWNARIPLDAPATFDCSIDCGYVPLDMALSH